ncbi:hypothetical protein BDY19DRAFT_199347 [Irpex rosettiformis]|uniref:Uncharacterized protein n=1 Tax=Irpex rosettiformis TaxID=378272 RepID=A0ACB8U1G5_9APHY|nr:hypothetical protein BDY19DRAFT_199347 [Irpex rosettiformis]
MERLPESACDTVRVYSRIFPRWRRSLEGRRGYKLTLIDLEPDAHDLSSTMTSAWQYPVHSHPWFRMPTHKRKAFEREDSSSSDYSDFERYVHPPKRLKYGILESGLAQLSLDTAVQVPIVTEPYLPSSSSGSTFAYGLPTASQSASNAASLSSGGIAWDGSIYDVAQADPKRTQSVVLPGSVEEPTSPEAPRAQEDLLDVRMKSRSWYEPEKDRK